MPRSLVMRCGFTLIETLVALVVLEFAMLALAAASAVAARDLAFAHRSVRAQSLARNRVELLWAAACSTPASGTATVTDGFTERWSVETVGDRKNIAVSVEFALPRRSPGRVALSTSAICQP